jgi:hypothetical protein
LVKRTGSRAIAGSAQIEKSGPAPALAGVGPASGSRTLLPVMEQVRDTIAGCERCSRLREYCRGIGETRRKAYIDQVYWARPVAGFGDVKARILVLGWRRERMAPIAPGGPSPATERATLCIRCCMNWDSPASRWR